MRAIANNPDFSVIDETDDYIVVNKPAPLQIHPKKPGGPATLFDGLRDLLAFEIANGGQVSIVNRLDRETSGVVLIAKNGKMARQFGLAMQARRFRKKYLALAAGWPSWEEVTCDASILRQGDVEPSVVWVKQIVHDSGAACCTHFRVVSRNERLIDGQRHLFSLIEASPITGRMHQIRVHLSHLGHPIVGDKIYGPDERCYLDHIASGWTPDLEARLLLPRHALHSCELSLETDEFAACWCSPLPDDLRAFIET
jgi:23S rRNA pseudouridine1911/1915/1917 synthase